MSQVQQAILDFWFGDAAASDADIAQRQGDLWWGKSAAIDATIGRDFGLLLLTDQFRRNLYRDQADAFALDELARGLTRQCLRRGGDRRLRPVQRVFVYLPLEHSESLVDQGSARHA